MEHKKSGNSSLPGQSTASESRNHAPAVVCWANRRRYACRPWYTLFPARLSRVPVLPSRFQHLPSYPLFLTDGFIDHSMLHSVITIIVCFLRIVCSMFRGDHVDRFDPSDSIQQVIRAHTRSQSRRGNQLIIRSLIGRRGAPNWRSAYRSPRPWFLH